MNNNKINYNSTLHPDVIKQIKQLVDWISFHTYHWKKQH
jgi:hypothetical protein